MSEAAKEAKRAYHRAYQKDWRRKNPDKIKEYQNRYWEKKAAKNTSTVKGGEKI